MDKKEKVQDFNQRFTPHLNNFSAIIKLVEETLIEYYTSTLSPSISMFVKRSINPSLAETYGESNKVEAELEIINKHTAKLEIKTFDGKKPLMLTKPKEENSTEL